MLVLTRKIGEQVVLPSVGVTLTVMSVGGNRVRLGVTAPRETPVHRRELWDKINQPACPDEGLDGAGHPGDGNNGHNKLAKWIDQRTSGRVRSLSVEEVDGRLVIHGRATSYYALQLVQLAVREATTDDPRPVELAIDVVP